MMLQLLFFLVWAQGTRKVVDGEEKKKLFFVYVFGENKIGENHRARRRRVGLLFCESTTLLYYEPVCYF